MTDLADLADLTVVRDETCTTHEVSTMDAATADSLARTFKALADPLRLRMLTAVVRDERGETCVCDLNALAEVSQPTISHHLRVLREAGLVTSERRGTWVWYRIPAERRAAIVAVLDQFARGFTGQSRR